MPTRPPALADWQRPWWRNLDITGHKLANTRSPALADWQRPWWRNVETYLGHNLAECNYGQGLAEESKIRHQGRWWPCHQHTWGTISPKVTMARVEQMMPTRPPPPVMVSRLMVKVLLTRTLPSRMEQSRKLPIRRSGMMAYRKRILVNIRIS
jgi:hypothetical protein